MPGDSASDWLAILDHLLIEMIDHQERKLMQLAREIVPDLTSEDMRNPQDFAALARDPAFNWEDGTLAGLRSAHMAIRAEFARRRS